MDIMSTIEEARALMDEYYALAHTDRTKYTCLELLHSAFVADDGTTGAWRIVTGRLDPLVASLPNGSTAVFSPGAFDIKWPEKNSQGRRDFQLTMDAVTRTIFDQLERVSNAEREVIRANIYEYRDDDLTAPGRIYTGLTLEQPRIVGGRAQGNLTYTDSNNMTVPSIKYTLSTHPGLAS